MIYTDTARNRMPSCMARNTKLMDINMLGNLYYLLDHNFLDVELFRPYSLKKISFSISNNAVLNTRNQSSIHSECVLNKNIEFLTHIHYK